MPTTYLVKEAYGLKDGRGSDWVVVVEKNVTLYDHVAVSRDYAIAPEGAYVEARNQEALAEDIDEYVSNHSKLSTRSPGYTDKNGALWIVVYAHPRWRAVTLQYGGAVVEDEGSLDIVKVYIEDFAASNKGREKILPPTAPGIVTPPVVKPSVPIPTVPEAIRAAAKALAAVKADLTPAGIQAFLAIARFESGFGTIQMKNGFLEADGRPTNNWGARKGTGDAGCYMHADADEKKPVCFAKYSSAEKGVQGFFQARAFQTAPFAAQAFAAANAGDAYGLAKAMKDGGYYTGFGCGETVLHATGNSPEDVECAIRGYASAIEATVRRDVAPALGQQSLVKLDPSKQVNEGMSTGSGLLWLGAAAGIGYYLWRR